ncbi:MAG: hypothetical protein K5888_00820 [Lachnospiraceae bacterium]|nr:hypothetical protein [Lachnospiraceae bacterium]
MTSKRSFSANTGIAGKQKIWMWIVSILSMLIMYPSVLIIYLNRIISWYPTDTPAQKEIYIYQMKEAVCDALGYRYSFLFFGLGVVFAFGIFGYLNNRSKVDMIKSVPVKARQIYMSDYVSGVVICVIPYAVSLILSLIIALGWGFLTALAVKEAVFTFVLNMAVFFLYYNVGILCICLTGNLFVAFGGFMALSFGPVLIYSAYDMLKDYFFKSSGGFYMGYVSKLLPLGYTDEYSYNIKMLDDFGKEMKLILPDAIPWFIAAVVTGILAYLCFAKRPAEATHKAVWSKALCNVLKLIIIPSAALIVSIIVYQSSAEIKWIMVVSAIVTAVLTGMMLEAIFAFDLKGALKGLWSTGLGAVIAVVILAIFFTDAFGFDKYVPTVSSLDSFALETYPNAYGDYFEIMDGEGATSTYGAGIRWVDTAARKRDNMFLKQNEAMIELARLAVENDLYNNQEEGDVVRMDVLYRLRGGRKVTRCIAVNRDDPRSLELLDVITGSDNFNDFIFAPLTQEDELDKSSIGVSYTNGVGSENMDMMPSSIIEIWREDSKQLNYSFGLENYPCGSINIALQGGMSYTLPVYDSFTGTLNAVKKSGAYLSNEFDASDIESIIVSNYHSEVWDDGNDYYGDPTVSVTIDDPEEIKELLKSMAPGSLWKLYERNDNENGSYDISVLFDKDYDYSKKGESFYFRFTSPTPEWIKERTTL